jgi:RND family efflux transporter MFP subunit
LYFVGLIGLGAAVAGVLFIGTQRSQAVREDEHERTERLARGPRLRVATVGRSAPVRHLVLQGEARPFAEVTLYAKVSGYLHNLKVDKGDRVKANQLLATIDSPELDEQYRAAEADAKNKRVTEKRYSALGPSGIVAAQEVDLARTSADVAEATKAVLSKQRGYRIIRAPFDGTVTARFADPGTLIQSAVNAQSGAVPVVTVSKTELLRVYVYLDQTTAPFVKVGDPVEVRVPERPGFVRAARITRMAGQLSPKTRTMLTEVDVENADGAILSGSFVEVTLDAHRPSLLEVPAEALVLRGEKPFVAVVDPSKHLHFHEVVLADDDGKKVRLLSGVNEGDKVAMNVGDGATEGAAVDVVPVK